jgi:hypothetical protein
MEYGRCSMSTIDETKPTNPPPVEGPESELECMYIKEYLAGKGYRFRDLIDLPKDKARQLMIDACNYASGKLAEIESRARFREEIHSTLT